MSRCYTFEEERLCGNYRYEDKYFNGSAGECQTCVDGDMYRGHNCPYHDGDHNYIECRTDSEWKVWKEERDKWLCRSVENCTVDVVCTDVPPVPPTPAPSPKPAPTPTTAIVAAVLGVAAIAALVAISWDVLGVLCAGGKGKGAAEEASAAAPAVASSPVAGDVDAAHADALVGFPALSATT